MQDKLVKARKAHECTICQRPVISKGESYYLSQGRLPVYVFSETGEVVQDGIEYVRERICQRCMKGRFSMRMVRYI